MTYATHAKFGRGRVVTRGDGKAVDAARTDAELHEHLLEDVGGLRAGHDVAAWR